MSIHFCKKSAAKYKIYKFFGKINKIRINKADIINIRISPLHSDMRICRRSPRGFGRHWCKYNIKFGRYGLSSAAAATAATAATAAVIVIGCLCGREKFVNRESYIVKEVTRFAFRCRRTFLGRNTEINRVNQKLGVALKADYREQTVRYVDVSYVVAYNEVIVKTAADCVGEKVAVCG